MTRSDLVGNSLLFVAVMAPLVGAVFFVDHKGELGLLVVALGGLASVLQAACWSGLRYALHRSGRRRRAMFFGAAALSALIAATIVLAVSQRPIAAIVAYIAATLAAFSVKSATGDGPYSTTE